MYMQPYMPKENMLVLQESNINEMGAFLIYGSVDLPTITSIFNGGDVKYAVTAPRYHHKP